MHVPTGVTSRQRSEARSWINITTRMYNERTTSKTTRNEPRCRRQTDRHGWFLESADCAHPPSSSPRRFVVAAGRPAGGGCGHGRAGQVEDKCRRVRPQKGSALVGVVGLSHTGSFPAAEPHQPIARLLAAQCRVPLAGGRGGNRREPSDKRFILNATSNVHHRGAHAIERIRRGKRSPRWTPARRIGRLGGDTIAEYLYLKRVASSNQVPTTCGSATRMHHDTRHPGTYNISTSARGNTAEASRMGCIQCPS